jgi:type I restriction enzyme S subunit
MKYPRYPAYKDSGVEWIGEIPKKWEVKKLKWCLSRIESGNREIGGGNQLEDGVFSIGGEHIDWEGNLSLINPKYISESFYHNLKSGKVKELDILLVKDGATIGKVVYVQELPVKKVAINEHVFLLRANNFIFPKFLYYFLYSKIGQIQIERNIRGAAQGGLNSSFVQRMFITLPPINVQNNFSSFLDNEIDQLNKLIYKQSQMIDLLKEKRQAIITHAVTKGLDPNEPMKDSGVEWIGEIPEHWMVTRLKFISCISANYGLNLSSDNYLDKGVRFIRITDINEDGTLIPDGVYISEDLTKDKVLKKGDLLFARSGSVGTSFLFDLDDSQKYSFAGYLVRFRLKMEHSPSFVYFSSQSKLFKDQIKMNSIETTIDNFNGEKYSNLKFGLPPLDEQIQISNYIKVITYKIEDLISKQQKIIEYLNEYKTSLITQAVTGKIDVRGFALPIDSNSTES